METPSVKDILSQYLKQKPQNHPALQMMETIEEAQREGTVMEE